MYFLGGPLKNQTHAHHQRSFDFPVSALLVVLALSAISVSTTKIRADRVRNPRLDLLTAGAHRQNAQRLEASRTVTGGLMAGESALFQLPIEDNNYYQLIVEHQRLNVTIRIAGTDNRVMSNTEGAFGEHGVERVSILAKTSEEVKVSVVASQGSEPQGEYAITLEGPRPPGPADLSVIAAERLFGDGRRLMRSENKDVRRQAIAKFLESNQRWVDALNPGEGAKCRFFIGEVYRGLGDRLQAESSYNEALRLSRQAGYRRAEAYSLSRLGLINLELDKRKSIEFSKESLPLWNQEQDRINEAVALNNIGLANDYLWELEQALFYYTKANEVRSGLLAKSGTCSTLNNIGLVYDKLGEPQLALDYYRQAESLLQGDVALSIGDQRKLAKTINNLAYAYATLGDFDVALDRYQSALSVAKAIDDIEDELTILVGIGRVLTATGQPREALTYYRQALRKVRSLRAQWGAAAGWGEAYGLLYLGHAHAALGRLREANLEYVTALNLFRANGDREGEATVLTRMGALFGLKRSPASAVRSYNQALAIWRAIRDPRGQAAALYGIARVERDRGNLVEAHKNTDDAIRIVEALRARVVRPDLRSSYLASVRDYYDLDIDVLMQLHSRSSSAGFEARALELSERARARSFLESLGEVGKEIREGVEPNLLELEQSQQRRIEAKIQAQIGLLKTKGSEEQAAQIDNELKSLIGERKATEEKIRIQSPRYAALVQPQPIGVETIQKQLLDSETLLLEFALGERRSYLWLVSTSQISSYELPRRAVLEASAKQVYSLVSSREAVFPKGQAEYWKKAAVLSRMILGPAAGQLGNKRLVIVAEGALQYVPFDALPIPRASPLSTGSRIVPPVPLIAEHEIISLPSVSVVAALRAELATRRPAGNGVAVFADPVFDNDDGRLASANNNATGSQPRAREQATRGVLREFHRYGVKLDRLENSRAEADAIRSMSNEAKINLGFDANLQNVKSADLGSVRIVHFATHGLLDSDQPDLSCIVLSLVDARGEKQNGFLLLNDIYNLKLSADLVVLSACSTGLGKDIKGEGLVGLTRGFMYAGAARVMASLWNVDDKRTAELMKLFYEKMLKQHMQPAAALRAAQIEMWRSKHSNSPYYWGAFVLQGEWKDTALGNAR